MLSLPKGPSWITGQGTKIPQVMQRGQKITRKYMQKYLGLMRHYICNLLSGNPGKKLCVCIDRMKERETGKENVIKRYQ